MAFLRQFCSGLSTRADFQGIVDAGVAPGIQVGDLRGELQKAVMAHLARGGPLFVDSGAFPAFMAGGTPVDFEAVLANYDRLAAAAVNPRDLFVVAPDKIADQAETERLLTLYAPRLRQLAARGVSILVPVQAGEVDMVALWERLGQILAGIPIIPAMPMRAAAVTVERVVSFLRRAEVSQVHLLGTSKSRVIDTISLYFSDLVVTADANRIRSAVGEGRPLTEDYRATLEQECETEWYDGGEGEVDGTDFTYEALNTPGYLTPAQTERIIRWLADFYPEDELRVAYADRTLGDYVDGEIAGWLFNSLLQDLHRERVTKVVGPTIRRAAVTRHFRKPVAETVPLDLFAAVA